MRTIKFRVWNTIDKQWSNKIFVAGPTNKYGIIELNDIKDLIIQQFTGLTDINGKEIYEGDILEINTTGSLLIFSLGLYIASVLWNQDRLCYELEIYTQNNKFENFNTSLYKDNGRTYKIIGNIYDNPDLLK